MIKHIITIPQTIACALIRLYQKTLSPDTGFFSALFPNGYCRFHPTCSEYAYQAIKQHGLILGIIKGTKRIVRCNPFNQGGVDLVK